MYMHVEGRGGCQVSSVITPHLVFEAGSQTEPEKECEVCWESKSRSSTYLYTPQPSPPTYTPALPPTPQPNVRGQTHVAMSGFSHGHWGSELGSLAPQASLRSPLPTDPSPRCHNKLLLMQIVYSFNNINLLPVLSQPALGVKVQRLKSHPNSQGYNRLKE